MAINKDIYNVYEWHHMVISPLRAGAKMAQKYYNNPFNPFYYSIFNRNVAAGLEVFERITRKYGKPKWGKMSTVVNDEKVGIKVMVSARKPFCKLIHFKKEKRFKQPKLLIVAPMSGHYATLLRDTIEGTLPFFDVYITEWINANEVPIIAGDFDLDDYINYVIEFVEHFKGDVHLMAVCQPVVPVAAAVAIMEKEGNKKHPKSMTLVGGPIDGRINPTMVNDLADKKPIEWFQQNLVSRVPLNYPGAGRQVYPGFLQLASFISMKPESHIEKHKQYFQHLVEGDGESAEKHEKFYDEYLSVMDIPAEFYLQTIKTVFQDFALPLGKMVSRGREVNLKNIKKTAMLALEGEKDDISGLGQSKAALKLAKNLSSKKKEYYMQKDVGHYGIFSGRKFREQVVPVIYKFAKKHD